MDHVLLSEEHQLWEALDRSGLVGKKLACFSETDVADSAGQLCLGLGVVYESRFELMVRAWIREAKTEEPLQKRIRGEHTMDLIHMSDEDIRRAARGEPSGSGVRRVEPEETWRPRPLRSRPATDIAQAKARQEAEDDLKEKWAHELVVEMQRVHAPALRELEHCVDESRVPLALAGKTRLSTLRRYVKTWRDWLAWLISTKGSLSASSPGIFCEYLFHRFDEPCGPTVPPFLVKAVAWFEKTAMLPTIERVAESQVVYSVRNHIVGILSRSSPPVRRAPRYPAVAFEAFQNMVLDSGMNMGIRITAWVKLLKLWGCLRYDDLQRISPSELKYTLGRLSTILRVTKTSGPTKRVQELPVVITEEAYLNRPEWLKVGFDLLKKGAPLERDYLLPKLSDTMSDFVPKMATYNDMRVYAGYFRRLVKLPGSRVTLFPLELVSFWTEHSERATVPTGLAIIGSRKEERDMLGRWRPEGSDTYIRAYGGIVKKLQRSLAKVLRMDGRSSLLDETDIVEGATSWYRERTLGGGLWGRDQEETEIIRKLVDNLAAVPQFQAEEDDPIEDWELAEDEIALDDGDMPEEVQARVKYVVVNVSRSCRRQSCWRMLDGACQGVQVLRSVHDEARREAYTHVCRVCWPSTRKVEEPSEGSDGTSSSSSSSSSSAEEEAEIGPDGSQEGQRASAGLMKTSARNWRRGGILWSRGLGLNDPRRGSG